MGTKLRTILHYVHHEAVKTAPVAASHTFQSGLRVDLLIDQDGTYRMYLSRPDITPSLTEFRTVADHFPVLIPPQVEPRPATVNPHQDGRFYLLADWVPISKPADHVLIPF